MEKIRSYLCTCKTTTTGGGFLCRIPNVEVEYSAAPPNLRRYLYVYIFRLDGIIDIVFSQKTIHLMPNHPNIGKKTQV